MCEWERECVCVCECVSLQATHSGWTGPGKFIDQTATKRENFFQAQPTFSFNFNSKVVQLSLQTSVPLRKTSVLSQLCRLEQLSTDYIWQLYRFKRLYHLLEQLLIGWSAGKLPSFLCLFLNRPVVKLSFVWGSSRKVVSWWGAIFLFCLSCLLLDWFCCCFRQQRFFVLFVSSD